MIQPPGDSDANTVIRSRLTLPAPTKKNLGKIVEILKTPTTVGEKKELAALILNEVKGSGDGKGSSTNFMHVTFLMLDSRAMCTSCSPSLKKVKG
jgi:hypothetical protein